MLIYQQLRGKWNKEKSRYDFPVGQTRLLYKGRVALAFGGGGGDAAPPVPTGPWAPQVPYIAELFNRAHGMLQQPPPQYPNAPLTPGINPTLNASYNGTNSIVPQNLMMGSMAQQRLLSQASQPNPLYNLGQSLAAPTQAGIGQLIAGSNPVQDAAAQTTQGTVGAINQATAGGPGAGPTFGDVNAFPAIENALYSNGMNPFTSQIVDAALRTSNEQFRSNVLPGIRTEAGQAGQVGGTRHGIAEGIASRALLNQQGDVISRLYGQAFDAGSADRNAALQLVAQGQGLNEASRAARAGESLRGAELGSNLLTSGTDLRQQALSTGTAQGGQLLQAGVGSQMDQYLRSLGLLPQLQAGQLANLGFQNQAGLQQYGIQQQGIDAELDRYFYNMLAPYNALTQYQNFIAGAYGSSLPGNTPYFIPQGSNQSQPYTPPPQGAAPPPQGGSGPPPGNIGYVPPQFQTGGQTGNFGIPQYQPSAQPYPWAPRTGNFGIPRQ